MRQIHGVLRSPHRLYCASAANQMKQAVDSRPRSIKFYVGSQRNNVETLKKEKRLETAPGWIDAFCSKKENDLLVRVDIDFVKDQFNLHGLNAEVVDYHGALRDILEHYRGFFDEDAEKLYTLIHRRYILSSKGLDAMAKKFKLKHFETCPKSCCDDQIGLPVGESDVPGTHTVRFFCPRCEDLFDPIFPHHSNVDGAYFGSTFAHLLLLTHPDLKPCDKHKSSSSSSSSTYVPRVFGFRIHKPSNLAVEMVDAEMDAA